MKKFFIFVWVLFFPAYQLSAKPVVNVYVWGGEIPKQLIHQFEHQTGITVNFSTYDSNETMYAKLKSSSKSIYDVILPSAYFVERMRKQHLLEPIDHSQLTNLTNLDARFINNQYDPGNQYSVPLTWGATGIFYNQQKIKQPPHSWQQLWQLNWRNQLMLLDDPREVFALALMSLGFNPNDNQPQHIEAAYHHLLQLIPNIKLFASDGVQATIIDEDASIGTAWNGDAHKAHAENNNIKFVYPEEGFVIWIDCLAIPKNPPHPQEAITFINFMLKAKSSAAIALIEGHAITNAKGRALLPKAISQDPMVYPSDAILNRAYLQRDLGEKTLALYNQYWQKFKLAF